MMNKYNAKPFYYNPETGLHSKKKENSDDLYFASMWEYRVYCELKRYTPHQLIQRQYKVEIKPKTFTYPAMHWKADFAIVSTKGEVLMLVEAKGLVTNDFKVRLRLLEYLHHQLWKIVVVVKDGADKQSFDSSRKRTCNLSTLQQEIDKLIPFF